MFLVCPITRKSFFNYLMASTATQVVALSKEPEFEGFDNHAGQTWIYPTNYPMREYQFSIIEKALLKNTLVSLPTGLGKTFIAAVIMYNIFRWYPQSKIIFMAPTKPLVKQQVDACYNIMAIPSDVTAELTGAKGSAVRADIWMEKRVFFITPQVLQNDLNTIAGLAPKIKCIVFDEAHKARGNHAYCEVIRRLTAQNHKYFRVLALSATPGNSVDDVLEVIQNLLISHLEFRSEESLDVQPYVFQRSLETVVVPLDEKLQQVKDEYLKILDYYTRTLKTHNVIHGNFSTLTKGKIFMTMKDFQQKTRGNGSNNYSEIMRSLNICVTLYHAYELLTRHGLRSFYSFFTEHIDKPLLRGNHQLRQIVDEVKNYIGPIPDVELLPDGTYPDVPVTVKFGHPKYYRLRDILEEHFSTSSPNSRVIVFFEYRESVMEAHMMLLQARPLIRPRIFLGQGAGITQRLQVNVVKAFREGTCNALLSTCIGEEGLDVGDVDLIVIFDISNKSPIRMVQRMGRTGRKREGRVVVLVTEGREQQTLKDCLIYKNNISNYVLGSKQLKNGMYPESPRLVPPDIQPKCEKLYITVPKQVLKKNSTLKDMLRSISSSSSEPQFSENLEIKDVPERIPKLGLLYGSSFENNSKGTIFYKHIEKQRALQKCKIGNSHSTKLLVNLLQFADSKRFNIPSQMQGNFSQMNRKNLKQSDIRSMFIKPTPVTSQKNFEAFENEVGKTKELIDQISKESVDIQHSVFPRELFLQISNYISLANLNSSSKPCKICPSNINCDNFCIDAEDNNNNSWLPLDDTVFQNISPEDMAMFTEKLEMSSNIGNRISDLNELLPDLNSSHITVENTADTSQNKIKIDETPNACDISDSIFNNIAFTQLEKQAQEKESIITTSETTFTFQMPKTLQKILDQYPLEMVQQNSQSSSITSKSDILYFFNLESVGSIFECTQNCSQDTLVYSPVVIPDTPPCDKIQTPQRNSIETNIIEEPGSPILSHSDKVRRVKRKLMLDRSKDKALTHERNSPEKKHLNKTSKIDTPSKFTMNCTKISSTPLPVENNHKKVSNNDFATDLSDPKAGRPIQKSVTLDIEELCDLSMFGITNIDKELEAQKKHEPAVLLGLKDFCDTSMFGIVTQESTEIPQDIKIDKFTKAKEKNDVSLEKATPNNNEQNNDNHGNVKLNGFEDLLDQSVFNIPTQKDNVLPTSQNREMSSKEICYNFENHHENLSSSICEAARGFSDTCKFDLLTQKNTALPKSSKTCEEIETKATESCGNFTDDVEIPASKNRKVLEDISDKFHFDLLTQENTLLSKKSDTREESKERAEQSTVVLENNHLPKLDSDQKNTFNKVHDDEDFNVSEDIFDTSLNTKNLWNFSLSNKKCIEEDDKLDQAVNKLHCTTSTIMKQTSQNTKSNKDYCALKEKYPNSDKNTYFKKINFTSDCRLSPAIKDNNYCTKSEEKLTEPVPRQTVQSVVDLTQDSPEKASLKNKQLSQMSITQMLSFVNKSQKENVNLNSRIVPESTISNSTNKKNAPILNKIDNCSSTSKNLNLDILSDLANYEEFNTSFRNHQSSKKFNLSTKKTANSDLNFIIPVQVKKPINSNNEDDPYSSFLNTNKLDLDISKEISSDDEFEVVPKKSPSKTRQKREVRPLTHNSENLFVRPSCSNVISTKKKQLLKQQNPFIEAEAQLADESNICISEDEDEADLDYYDKSFVADETQFVDTQMHAQYLQTVKSPHLRGRFKIPTRLRHNVTNVYSQVVSNEDNTYVADSFCIEEDEVFSSSSSQELSELDILEKKLKERRKQKRKKSAAESVPAKRRRIKVLSSDDSD